MIEPFHIDFETRSDVDITTRGSYVYFESPLTAPLMASFKQRGGSMQRWLPSEPCPDTIRKHHEAGGLFVAHNAGSFEFQLWKTILAKRYRWPEPNIKQFRCTLAKASALGLPRRLEKLGDALNLTVKKDKIGKSLIDFFSKPRKPKPGEDPTKIYFNEPHEFPEKFELFRSYCDDDVRTEEEADSRMIPLSDFEQSVWELDQKINERGIRIDVRSCRSAIALVEKAKHDADAQMRAITHGAVTACSNVAKLKAWCAEQGVLLDGVAKDDITDALDLVDLPENVEKALLLRREAGKSSTSKLSAFLKRVNKDARARGSFVYHGAAPGRWCLAGGSPVDVRTQEGEILQKPIESVLLSDQVWDGEDWVTHQGVVFSGVKNVITYDGVTATPEHIVYLSDSEYTSLSEAQRLGLKIYEKRPENLHNLLSDVAVR